MPARSVPPWTPAERDVGDVDLLATRATLKHRRGPRGHGSLGFLDALHDGGEEKKGGELGVELGPASGEDHVEACRDGLCATIPAAVGHRIEGVGDRDDAGRERYAAPL